MEDDAGRPFVFVSQARNVAVAGPEPETVDPPPEPHHWTRSVWRRRRVRAYKYVDDGVTTEKVNFENALVCQGDGNLPVKHKQAIPPQNAFAMTAHRAAQKGMKVNTLKTNILCVTDALKFTPVAFIDIDGEVLESKPNAQMKMLGFTVGDRPTVKPHVKTCLLYTSPSPRD